MKLSDLKPAPGATQARKRVGRGIGSGLGKTSGKGHKGQKSRSGYSRRFGFEGGQMPLVRRIPKRGFSNSKFRTEHEVLNVDDLDRVFADGDTVDRAALAERGLVTGKQPVKVLGDGDLSKKLEVAVERFSKTAREKIEAAGGSCRAVDQ